MRVLKQVVQIIWCTFVAKRALSHPFVPGQISTTWNKDKGFCWSMPSPSPENAASNSFSYLPRANRLADTGIRSRVSTRISHLTQTFPPCCHGATVNMLLTQMKRYYWPSLSGLSVSIKILAHHGYRSVSGEMWGGNETLNWSTCARANSRLIDKQYN